MVITVIPRPRRKSSIHFWKSPTPPPHPTPTPVPTTAQKHDIFPSLRFFKMLFDN